MNDEVYVRINHRGFIGILNHWGPIPHCYLPKSTIISLIKEGYDVEILSADDCKEFAKEVEDLIESMKKGEFSAKIDENTLITGGKDDGISGAGEDSKGIVHPNTTDPDPSDIVKTSVDETLSEKNDNNGGINGDSAGDITSQMSELDELN